MGRRTAGSTTSSDTCTMGSTVHTATAIAVAVAADTFVASTHHIDPGLTFKQQSFLLRPCLGLDLW